MTLLRESHLYRIWIALCSVYEDSVIHHALTRIGVWCNAQINESRVLRPLCREGVVARTWPDSTVCRLLTILVNLPGVVLCKLHGALWSTFEDSIFSRLAFALGDSTAIAESWMIMLLWVIPFSHWNNAYSMMGFALLLVLFYVGAMHREDYRLDLANIGFYPIVLFGAIFLAVVLSYCYSILSALHQKPKERTTANEIAEYIAEHLKDPLTLDQLSDRFHFSKNHIINLFKAEYGTTPFDYINIQKLKKAERLLEVTSNSIKNIALESGFNDYAYFYKLFCRKHGISPVVWRERNQV